MTTPDGSDLAPVPEVPSTSRRSPLRAVALPSEHGGWGLTLEPVLLGLLIAPGAAGWCLGAAALLGFLARTPLKLVLVDLSRGRRLERTRTALAVAAIELTAIVASAVGALRWSSGSFWAPLALAVPLLAVELWFDMRSRSRRLVPELAGAAGISSVAAMIVLADGGSAGLAIGLWLIPVARSFASIPFVRDRVSELHGRTSGGPTQWSWDAAALCAAVAAVSLDRSLLAGAVAIAAVILYQHLSTLRPTPRAVVLGIRQTLLGIGVVVVTWLGVLAGGGGT